VCVCVGVLGLGVTLPVRDVRPCVLLLRNGGKEDLRKGLIDPAPVCFFLQKEAAGGGESVLTRAMINSLTMAKGETAVDYSQRNANAV